MKQITILLFLVLFATGRIFAQKKEMNQSISKHEIGIDFLDLSKYRKIELSYNYLLDENNSIGTIISFFESNEDFWKKKGYQEIIGVSGNYRHYFSNEFAQGFYAEGFVKYEFGHRYNITRPDIPIFRNNYYVINAGLGLGYKHVTKSNFYFDLNIGSNNRLIYLKSEGIHSPLLKYPNSTFNYSFIIGKRF